MSSIVAGRWVEGAGEVLWLPLEDDELVETSPDIPEPRHRPRREKHTGAEES